MDERSTRVADRLEKPIIAAALLTLPATIIEESNLRRPWPQVAMYLNWLIWLVFLAEAVIMLAVVPSKRDWLRSHVLEVLIVVLTPPALLTAVQPIRLLRLLRVLRLLRLGPLFRLLLSDQGLQYTAAFALLTAITGGAAYAGVEKLSFGDGVYWALETMTTVGYGDLAPTTTEGKIVAVFVMLIGIGSATLVIGAVAQRFVSATVVEAVEQAEAPSEEDMTVLVQEIGERLQKLERAMQRQSRVAPQSGGMARRGITPSEIDPPGPRGTDGPE